MSDETRTGSGPEAPDERLHRSDLPEGERPCLVARGRPRSGAPSEAEGPRAGPLTAEQRLLILDAWQRSGLPAGDFGSLVGVSGHTLYAWKRRFDEYGPAALESQKRGTAAGSRLPELTKRAVLMLKRAHPEWGCERLSDVLWRSQGHAASAGAVARYLKEQGYVAPEPAPSRPHAPPERRFERARVNQLWQSDLFTFLLKRESRRLYLVVFMDDRSRFLTSWGLSASAAGSLVREALLAGVANFGLPEEVLTDNGPQYVTWRGTSTFARLLRAKGIRHVVARPRRPQTLGKVERFWGSLWRECLEEAVFRSLEEARARVGLYIDHYNFHRPHQGIDGLTPADRFFEAEPEVLRTLRARVAPRAGELARDGLPRKAFYLTGRVGDAGISLHAEGERIVLTTDDGMREEVDLAAPGRRADEEEQIELPAVVTPAAREVEDGEDEAETDGDGAADEADALEREPGDGDGGSEEDGGGGAGGAGRAADAGGGGSEPGDLDGAVLRAGDAGAAGRGDRAGAAGAGPGADGGAAGAGPGAREDEADARGAADAGPAASGAAGAGDRAGAGGGDSGPASAPSLGAGCICGGDAAADGGGE